ncbi:MAG: LamG-like jellyroll fold domain-containing protein [Ignavibacteria bacterium]
MKSFTFFLRFFFIFLFINLYNLVSAQTDEYGSMNSNRILSGLGLAASYVNVPYQSAFEQNDDGTLEAWIYPTATGGNPKTIISKGSNPTGASFMWTLSPTDGKMAFRIGVTDFLNTAGTAPPLNQWSHVAVTWSGGPVFTVRFYLNGALNGTAITQTANWSINTDAVRIGGSQAFVSYFFQGDMDEVRYWSNERTGTQITNNRYVGIGDGTNCNSGTALTSAANYNGLMSSWTFNSNVQAYDNISGYNGTYMGSAYSAAQAYGIPIPYNFALKLPGGSTDNVRIPSNSVFNMPIHGTIELWFKPISLNTEQVLVCKGAATTTISFILGVAASTGKLYFGTGTGLALNSTGAGLTLNQWNHIAVTWNANGGNFEIRFYKNGKQNGQMSTILVNFPFSSDPIWVGNSQPYNLPASGWIDELRIWSTAQSESEIRNNMFASCRGMSLSNLSGAWNFDGNLLNFSSTSGINATFNNGATNNCRFSGFLNDTLTGPFAMTLNSHSTTINRTGTPCPFPGGFYINSPFITIPDNNPTGITDSITVGGTNQTVISVEVFLSIQHSYVGDLTISLMAPNGQSRNLLTRNGGNGCNVLSFFNDNFTYYPSSTFYLPPWGFLIPIQTFGNFGGSASVGTWKLKCVDGTGGDIGVLCGWGIRINNLVGINRENGNVPHKFSLYQNYPNPFNPSTTIKFDIPSNPGNNTINVKLELFDILGREVAVMINDELQPGTYTINWDASKYSSGQYFYRLTAGSFTETRKMMILK